MSKSREEIIDIACRGLQGSVPTRFTAEGVVDALIDAKIINIELPANVRKLMMSSKYGKTTIDIRESLHVLIGMLREWRIFDVWDLLHRMSKQMDDEYYDVPTRQ